MQNVKKSLSIKILASFTLLFLLISIFVNLFDNKISSAYATGGSDDVTYSYTFTSSDLYHIDTYFHSYSANYLATCLFSASSTYLSGTDYITITPNFYNVAITGLNLTYNIYPCFKAENGVYIQKQSYNLNRGTWTDVLFSYSSDGVNYNGDYYILSSYCSSNFNCNVVKIVLGVSSDSHIPTAPSGLKHLSLYYYDINGEYLVFSFYVRDTFVFNTRTYYLTSNFDDNAMYQQGYGDGYNIGVGDGNNQGYKDGYNVGMKEGYNNGYIVGVEKGNDYTFTSLLGAVIDVPVRTFTSLFNFELLGVNLAGFFSGLLTLAVILTIVKMIKGG